MDDTGAGAELDRMAMIVAHWRGLAVHAGDIVHGRSHDWAAMRQLRDRVSSLPALCREACPALIALTGEIATTADAHAHYEEIHRLSRAVLKLCAQAEAGIDLMRGIVGEGT